MAFRVEKEEYVNRTFRFSKKLLAQMEAVCDRKHISLNRLTVQCVEYALSEMEEDPEPSPLPPGHNKGL